MPSTHRHSSHAEPRSVRASQLLRAKKIWIVPLTIASVFIALVAAIYIGSVINPTGHLHALPVIVVNEDRGANIDGHHLNLGASVASALKGSAEVTRRLALRPATLAQARQRMDSAGAYATLVIPATLTRSALLATGHDVPGATPPPARATVSLEENQRMGSLGVNLAAGVIAPAVAKLSPAIGRQLAPLASAATKRNPILADRLADPIELATAGYRPLPDHSALGLSAFYVALLSILSGFIGATLVNSSIDAALGYATSELGPRWKQARPVAIDRRQTFLAKWAIAALAAPLLTGVLLLVAVAALGMHAPHLPLLWLLCALSSLMIATGTLALLATFGSIGQLLAMLLLVYLSLASSGGTVPIQALPGVFNVVGHVEPLRQVLTGTRAILYFEARGDAGLTHSLVIVACELAFWALLGLAVTSWYDRRKLDRIAPDLLRYVERAVDRRVTDTREPA
jgi:YhgE/Pip-like protein